MFRGQQEFRIKLAPKSALKPVTTLTSRKAETSIEQLGASDAEDSSPNAVAPQMPEEDMQNQRQHQQKLLQELLQEQDVRMQRMLQEQEKRLKEVFSTQISALAATFNVLMQREVSRVDVGTQCSKPEEAIATEGGQGHTDSSSTPKDCESIPNKVNSITDVPTAKGAETSLEQPPKGSIRSAVSASSMHLSTHSQSIPPLRHGASQPPSASLSTTSLQGSSPEVSAFLLGLSANDVISSSDADTDSDNEGGLLRLRGRLDTTSEESSGEGSVRRWVGSLVSRREGSLGLLSRTKPANALRHRARATGGQLAAARARAPAAALAAFRSTSRAPISTVRPAAAMSAVATAASLCASRRTSTATAAPSAEPPSASLVAVAPAAAISAVALATALSAMAPARGQTAMGPAFKPAPSTVRPTATAATSPAQSGSAQAHPVDADVLDAGVVQAAEADAVHPAHFGSAESGADDVEVGTAPAAEPDAAQPASADATEAVQSLASDAVPVSMAFTHQAKAGAQSAAPHRGTNGDVQRPTSERQQFGAGNADSACPAPEDVLPSSSLGGFVQLTAAADQLVDAPTAVAAAAPQRSSSSKWVQDSFWDYDEDLGAGDDYFSASGPWAEAQAPSEAAPSVEPVTAVAAQESAAPMTDDTVGSQPSTEHVNPTAEGAQLGGLTFGSISLADLLGVEQRQHGSLGTTGYASSVAAATAAAPAPAVATAVTAATGSAAVGSTAVDASEAGMVPVDMAVAGLDAMSADRSGAAAQIVDESTPVSQLGISHGAQERQTAATCEHDSASLHDTAAMVEEEGEGDYQDAGLSGRGVQDPDWEEGECVETVDTSLPYTAFLTGSLLGRMERQAGDHADKIKALGVAENLDLMEMGGHDSQAMYNIAVMEGVNEQLAAAKSRACYCQSQYEFNSDKNNITATAMLHMQAPAPVLQQPLPLRKPPGTPRAIACAVHDDIMGAVHLAGAPMPDGFKHNHLLRKDANELLKSVEEGTAKTEACLKMALADSIFDDIIGDTAEAFLDAHGLQTPSEIND